MCNIEGDTKLSIVAKMQKRTELNKRNVSYISREKKL